MTTDHAADVLLDTTSVIHVARDNLTGREIIQRYGLIGRERKPFISSVTLGEVGALALWWGWGARRMANLEALLDEFTVISAGLPEVIDKYSMIKIHTLRIGHTMSHNDLWIAAACSATASRLITSDADFDRLHPHVILRDYIPPA